MGEENEARLGEFIGLPATAYHADSAIGSSSLGAILRSPAHFHARMTGEALEEESDAMSLGTSTHYATLEPELFEKTYVVSQKFDRRTKEGKAAHEAFKREHRGKIVIDPDDYETTLRMRDALLAHPTARKILERKPTLREASYFWIDEETGIRCKCRPDLIVQGALVVDLKTTKDASPAGFRKSIVNYGYHRQRAHYLAGIQAVTRVPLDEWVFLTVENVKPHGVAIYRLDEEFAELGERRRREALEKIKAASASGRWRTYNEEKAVTLSAPRYAFEE